MIYRINPPELPDIHFVGGEAQDLNFRIYRPNGTEPVDLTGASCSMTVSHDIARDDAVLSKTPTIGTLDGYTHISVLLKGDDTRNLFGRYTYQIAVTMADGSILKPMNGTMMIANNINRNFVSEQSDSVKISKNPPTPSYLTYTGSLQSPTWSGYDANVMTMECTPQSAAGSYRATFTLTNTRRYKWSTTSYASITVNWSIEKADPEFTLEKSSVSFTNSGQTQYVRASWKGNGTMTVTGNDTTVATAATGEDSSGKYIRFQSVGGGDTGVSAAVSEGASYRASSAKYIDIHVAIPQIYSWRSGTESQLSYMLQSFYDGSIDPDGTDAKNAGWIVGAERDVHLSANSGNGMYGLSNSQPEQDATFILMHRGGFLQNTGIECIWVVGTMDCLEMPEEMNPTDTNSGGYKNSRLRAWLGASFPSMLPSGFESLFKQFKIDFAVSSSKTETTGGCKFEVPSLNEIRGSTYGDGTFQFDYYANDEYAIEKWTGDVDGAYWTRTANFRNSEEFYWIAQMDDYGSSAATEKQGIPVFGVL